MNLDEPLPDIAHEALRLALVDAVARLDVLEQQVADLSAQVAALTPHTP